MSAADTVMLLGHSVPIDAVITGATGILGAILGSVVTVVWTEFFNARVRWRERKGKQAVGSFAMYHKLNRVLSTAEQLRRHLKQSVDEAIAADVPFTTMRVMPVSRLNEDFEFTTDELWVMIQVGGHELMNKVQSLDQAHSLLNRAMSDYEERRNRAMARLPNPTAWENVNVGTVGLTAPQVEALRVVFVPCELIIQQMLSISTETVDKATEALRALVWAPKRPLGKEFAISLPDVDGNMVTIRAKDAPRPRRRCQFWRKPRSER